MNLGIPQIIMIFFLLLSVAMHQFNHGKNITGKYNMYLQAVDILLVIGLLKWGGFF